MRSYIKFCCLLLVTVLAFAQIAFCSSLYLGLNGGYSKTYGNPGKHFEASRGHGLLIGYRFDAFWSMEGGLFYAGYDPDENVYNQINATELRLTSINILLFPLQGKLRRLDPYFIAGWAYGRDDIIFTAPYQISYGTHDDKLYLYPFTVGIGGEVSVNNRLSLCLDARYSNNLWDSASKRYRFPYGNTFYLSGTIKLYVSCEK